MNLRRDWVIAVNMLTKLYQFHSHVFLLWGFALFDAPLRLREVFLYLSLFIRAFLVLAVDSSDSLQMFSCFIAHGFSHLPFGFRIPESSELYHISSLYILEVSKLRFLK